jgi:hypothetical protein
MEPLMYRDSATGRYVYLVEKDGKPCPHYFHETKVTKQYTGYNVIMKDLGNARGAFAELDIDRTHSPIIRLSLLHAGIILYGKCFNQSTGRKTTLNYKTVFDGMSQELTTTHLHLIDLRNQYVAHAGAGEYEQYPLSVNLNPDINNKAILGYMLNGIQQVHHEPFLKKYMELIDSVIAHVAEVIERLAIKLNQELSELDLNAVYDSSITPVREQAAPITGIVKFPAV